MCFAPSAPKPPPAPPQAPRMPDLKSRGAFKDQSKQRRAGAGSPMDTILTSTRGVDSDGTKSVLGG